MHVKLVNLLTYPSDTHCQLQYCTENLHVLTCAPLALSAMLAEQLLNINIPLGRLGTGFHGFLQG